MPCERKPMRYGHSEGHTEVCFDEHGKFIVTCGSDGDVRIWESLDDDDPKSINVGEKAYSVALRGGKLVTAVSNNTVQSHTFPDGDPDGILTRFTTNANHITFNSSGTRIAAGSSDFLIKVIEVMDSSQQKTLRGHDAPVLSVTFDPSDEYVASSSCDGSVVVWSIEEQTQVVNWKVLQNSNDVSNAKSLCRLAWQGSGKLLAVPVDITVQLYERDTWAHVGTLSDDLLTQQVINVVVWSPCGKFLAAGTVGGTLSVWDVEAKLCIERQKHEKGYTVCGMAWHPSGGQIAYTDTEGCLGLLDGVCAASSSLSSTTTKNTMAAESKEQNGYDDLFDEDDGGLLDECRSVSAGEEDDDDDLMPATRKPRNRGNILDDDENSRDTGSVKVAHLAEDDGESGVFPAPVPPTAALPHPVYEGPMPTVPQRPFQPGSTPAHLMHRFMVWNSVGIVRSYNDEQDNAIDVEFHDTAVHHAMHLTNTLEHSMADLSQEAVLLACEGTDELASKLQCLHFSSWDTNKEWIVDLPKGEDVRALCLGQGWVAAATSAMLVRLFSIGGVQREMFSLPGPVVCMAGHGEQLLIVYHRGTGFDGDQALGVQLLQLNQKRKQIIHGEPLPLSRKSHLAWMGFSAEGTPCAVDSEGMVRMLNRSLGNTWTPVCNTRDSCKSKSDHYWVVGIHENPQQLRCIPCKGSVFPPTLPRPAVAILPFRLPFCQTSTEKGHMEEQYWRSVLFHNHFGYLSSSGYETDEESQRQQEKEQQELLMKMFALSCKLEREFRCVELAEMMTQSVVPLAIRYASRSRRMLLAQRLNELALEKASQLEEEAEPEEEPAYHSQAQNARFNQGIQVAKHLSSRAAQEDFDEEHEDEDVQEELVEAGEGLESKKSRVNPLSKGTKSPEKPSIRPVSKEARVNPFKVSGSGKPFASSSPQPRATNVLDTMIASNRKHTASAKAPVLKPLAPKPRSKAQATLLQMTTSKKSEEKEVEKPREEKPAASPGDNVENTRPKTGFQLWLEENRKSILADNPDLEEMDIIKEAMSRFRTLSSEERLKWTEKAKGSTREGADLKKRKRDEEENNEVDAQVDTDENGTKKKKHLDTSAKLSAFAFNKK
ncbi:WD repeat and HMG-box DNA-binding protein 1 isoform X2 [Neoarius graeffei]|uniref:WD repeat and HMG-box DNA-binding protein 1 isoform X2 n=1 Tax=Neoarius graeffei TaxID=443677 RepID=UPI00298D5FD4|nr:WD repeat and HMG-box DNA-binding protein 1 isoform X2 [Neoarius graeffei]